MASQAIPAAAGPTVYWSKIGDSPRSHLTRQAVAVEDPLALLDLETRQA